MAESAGTFRRGCFECAVVVAAFVAFGLVWRAGQVLAAPGAAAAHAHYPGAVAETCIWLVDGFNVLCAGVVGAEREAWWSARRRAELLDRAAHFDGLASGDAELWVVFDGPRPGESERGALRRVYARSADAWLLERLRRCEDPSRVAVVTADRKLGARARHRGASVVSPRSFLERCREGAAGEFRHTGAD